MRAGFEDLAMRLRGIRQRELRADHRRDRLAGMVAGAEQVLVTAAVPGDVPEGLAGARVDVMGSEVRRIR